LRRLNYTGVFAPNLGQRAGNPIVALTLGMQPFVSQLVPMVLKQTIAIDQTDPVLREV